MNTNKALWTVSVGLLALVAFFAAYAWKTSASARSESLSCSPTLQAQCPSEDFLRAYDHWRKLRDQLGNSDGSEVVTVREQRSDEFAGLTNRLQGMVPKGYQFDDIKRRYVIIPQPVSPLTQVPGAVSPSPVPAPAPVAPAAPTVATPAPKK